MDNYIDLAFFTMGENYLHTVKNILTENLRGENKWVVLYEWKTANEIKDEDYAEQTKRSDFNVFIPTIFLLYHWLELIFKWILYLEWKEFESNHKISILYETIKENNDNLEFIKITEKYIDKNNWISLIWTFLEKNYKTIDSFYEIFRYPSNRDWKELYKYFDLKYNEDIWIIFSKQVIEDIDFIKKRIVTTYRKKNKQ